MHYEVCILFERLKSEQVGREGKMGRYSQIGQIFKCRAQSHNIQVPGTVVCLTFFHHYQGSIDFNTVNIHRTVGMYFLVSTGNRGDIE